MRRRIPRRELMPAFAATLKRAVLCHSFNGYERLKILGGYENGCFEIDCAGQPESGGSFF